MLAIVAMLLRVCATVLLGNHVPCSRPNLSTAQEQLKKQDRGEEELQG